jgi:tripartite-type tricarboxylate transporter receptor subunit TctC
MSGLAKIRICRAISVGFLLALTAASSGALAQTYPDRPIRLIVPFSAGSNNDVIARIVANTMSQTLKQAIVIDNRVGAGGLLGATSVARAEPDGYTLLFANTTTMSVQPTLAETPPYDPKTAFLPISTIGRTPLILTVSAKNDIKSAQKLVEQIRKVNDAFYGTAGSGTPMHLAGASFGLLNQIKVNPVPYRASPEMTTALISGDVLFTFDGPTVVPFIKDDALRGLAVTGFNRMKDLPDVPTFSELGYKNFEYVVSWYGLVAPAGTSKAIISVLNAATRKAIDSKDVKDRLEQFGAETFAGTPEDMAAFMTKSADTWIGIIHDAGLGR